MADFPDFRVRFRFCSSKQSVPVFELFNVPALKQEFFIREQTTDGDGLSFPIGRQQVLDTLDTAL